MFEYLAHHGLANADEGWHNISYLIRFGQSNYLVFKKLTFYPSRRNWPIWSERTWCWGFQQKQPTRHDFWEAANRIQISFVSEKWRPAEEERLRNWHWVGSLLKCEISASFVIIPIIWLHAASLCCKTLEEKKIEMCLSWPGVAFGLAALSYCWFDDDDFFTSPLNYIYHIEVVPSHVFC